MPDVTFAKRFEYPPVGAKGPVGTRTVYSAGFSGIVSDDVASAATAANALTTPLAPAPPAPPKPAAKTASPPSPEIGEPAGGAKPA